MSKSPPFHLHSFFKVNDVEKSILLIEELCHARDFQLLRDEFKYVIHVVPFPQVIRLYAKCLEYHISRNTFDWKSYLGITKLLNETKVDISIDDLVPNDVRDLATSIFLNQLAYMPDHIYSVIAWCRLYHLSIETCVKGGMTLLNIKPKIAIDFAQALHLISHFNHQQVMQILVEKNEIQEMDRLVHDNPQHQILLIHLMLELHVDIKVIKKRLMKFKLPPEDFPVYIQRRRRSTLRYLMKARQYGDIQDAVGNDHDSMGYVCNFLYTQCGHDNPVTQYYVHTFRLQNSFPDVIEPDPKFDLGANIDSPPPLPGFLTVKGLTPTTPSPIEFLSTPTEVENAVKYLLTVPAIGIDCEWRSSFDSFTTNSTENEPCALVQLASATQSFVIDVLAQPAEIVSKLLPLFESPHVLKIGLAVRGDFKILQVQRVHRVLDLQTLEKSLRGHTAPTEGSMPSLTDLSRHYLGLPMDKRVRMSNWARRPLTEAQLEYAALDALSLVHIFNAMLETHHLDTGGVSRWIYNVQPHCHV